MTLEQIHDLLTQAEVAEQQGRYEEAEQMLVQILDALGSSSPSIKDSPDLSLLRANAMCMLGVISWRRGDYTKALDQLDEALQLNEACDDKKNRAKILGNIGLVNWNLFHYRESLEYYGKALEMYKELGDKVKVAKHLGNIGMALAKLSDFPEALEYFSRSVRTFEELDDKDGLAMAFGSIGNVYADISDYPQALEYYGKSLSMHEELGRRIDMAINLGNIGLVHMNLSDYSQALEYYGKALSMNEELGNKVGIAINLSNIGSLHWSLSDYQKALEYHSKSLSIVEELDNKLGIAINFSNIGIVHHSHSDYQNALEFFSKALSIDEKLGNRAGVALHLSNIGNVYQSLLDYPQAIEYLNRAISIFNELGQKAQAAVSLGNLGEIYFNPENLKRDEATAEMHLLDSIARSEVLGTKNYEPHRALAELYKSQERWKESHYHLEKYYQLKDKVQSQEARKTALQMDQRRLIAERDKELAIARAAADAKMSATTTLLYKVLPESVAARMINGDEEIADYFPQVSILFADIAGFTPISADMPAIIVVRFLNYVFGEFDLIIKKHGCEKIKTIGDGYMAVCGAPTTCDDHAERLAAAAVEMQETIMLPESIREYMPSGVKLGVRIGLHTGSVVAGVIGEERFVYDIYSDAVNTAARMESHGEENKIHVSNDFFRHMQNRFAMTKNTAHGFVFEKREEMEIKGKGMMRTYFLEKA